MLSPANFRAKRALLTLQGKEKDEHVDNVLTRAKIRKKKKKALRGARRLLF